MTTHLISLFSQAEKAAEKIIAIKEAALGIIAELIIPLPRTRKRFRVWFKNLLLPISQPLSEKIDHWIESGVLTVANVISISRALTGPIFFIFVMAKLGLPYYIALITWVAFTDYFDGIIARKMNQVSEVGAVIDAVCDKIFAVCAALSFWPQLWFWPAFFFLSFDSALAVLQLTLHAAKRRGIYQGHAQVKANWLGKFKYNLQAAALFCFMFNLTPIGNYCLWTANAFAFGSLVRHLKPSIQKPLT
jgi:phosphatidylglycerophosphate synthase